MDDEELDAIKEALSKKRRVYASMREGGTKEQKEFWAVSDLLASMHDAGDMRFANPRMAADDPPDCTVDTSEGELVAVEVTEFVSQEAVERNQRADPEAIAQFEPGAYVFQDWTEDDFVTHLSDVLERKDGKTLLGGPYDRYVVVVHTDEPFLLRAECEEWLAGRSFGPFKQIEEAYLLHGYEPNVGYAYSRLQLGAA